MKTFTFDKAPAELLSMLVDFAPMVQKFEAKNGPSNSQVIFYKKMLEVLRRSLLHMNDVEYIYKRNLMLEEDNELLRERLATIEKRLAVYEGIRESIQNGAFLDIVRRVNERMTTIPEDNSFLDGSEGTPEAVMTSFRRNQVNKTLDKIA